MGLELHGWIALRGLAPGDNLEMSCQHRSLVVNGREDAAGLGRRRIGGRGGLTLIGLELRGLR
jgi:hypothetical protein